MLRTRQNCKCSCKSPYHPPEFPMMVQRNVEVCTPQTATGTLTGIWTADYQESLMRHQTSPFKTTLRRILGAKSVVSHLNLCAADATRRTTGASKILVSAYPVQPMSLTAYLFSCEKHCILDFHAVHKYVCVKLMIIRNPESKKEKWKRYTKDEIQQNIRNRKVRTKRPTLHIVRVYRNY